MTVNNDIMKKNTVIIITILFGCINNSYSQIATHIIKLNIDTTLYKKINGNYELKDSLPDGYYTLTRKYKGKTQILSEGCYVNNKKEGVFKYQGFFIRKKKEMNVVDCKTYKAGVLHGPSYTYFKKDNLIFIYTYSNYVDGKPDGMFFDCNVYEKNLFISYVKNNKVLHSEKFSDSIFPDGYYVNDKKEGQFKYYIKPSKNKNKYDTIHVKTYKAGILNGPCYSYIAKNNKLIFIFSYANYKDGIIDGLYLNLGSECKYMFIGYMQDGKLIDSEFLNER